LQQICDGLSAAKINALLRKWLAKLPHPYTPADRKAGYRYNVSILQAEFSLTQVLDRPQTGRLFFEQVSALRFADPMVQALYSALLVFHLLPRGFSHRELRNHWAPLLGKKPEAITPGQMTYHLRRLRLHGLIARVPKSHCYRITDEGWRTILFCTRCHHRLLRPGFAQVLPSEAAPDTILRRRFDQLDAAIDQWLEQHNMAA
jgi:hypothetical protein